MAQWQCAVAHWHYVDRQLCTLYARCVVGVSAVGLVEVAQKSCVVGVSAVGLVEPHSMLRR